MDLVTAIKFVAAVHSSDHIHEELNLPPTVLTELHVRLSDINTVLMGSAITPVKSMSGNHRARQKNREENALWGLLSGK